MIKQMDMELIIIAMEQNISGIGKMICNMGTEQNHGNNDTI